MAKFTGGTTPIDLSDFDAELQDLDDGATSSIHTTTQFRRDEIIPTDYVDFFGTKFTYNGSNILNSGTINHIVSFATSVQWDLSSVSLTDAQLDDFISKGNGQAFLTAVFAGNDSIGGSSGNDTLQGFAGNDSFNGGKGDDVYHVDDSKDVVTESLTLAAGGGTDLVVSKGTFTLGTNVDNLQLLDGATADGTGNAIANTLTGNSSDNKLTGLAGDDNLAGNAGNDTLDGGTGNDTMTGGAGDDLYIVDSAGDQVNELGANIGLGDTLKTNQNSLTGRIANIEDYIFTGATAVNFDAKSGSADDNNITGAAAADTLLGDTGDDTLSGLGGNDSLSGGDGNDSLDGGVGMDSMDGGKGNDVYVVDNAKDSVDETGGDGTDTVRASITVTLASFTGIENIELTGAGAINATGNDDGNVLKGNAGANKLDGVLGNDTMDGGKGNDTYTVNVAGDQVSEDDAVDGGGLDTVISAASYSLGKGIENLTLAPGLANIDATGNELANTLTGNDGNNLLDGGTGADKLIGGKGDDTYLVDDLKDTVTESVAAGGGDDLVRSKVTFTLGANLERLELIDGQDADGTGNTLANSLTGNAQNNKLSGMAGDDVLVGNGGNDTLDGGAGNDTMTGGTGDDLFIVDSLGDKVNTDTGGTDELRTNQNNLNNAIVGIENYTFTGTQAVNFTATNDNTKNRITGTSAADTFDAKGGDDFVAGLAGNDTLTGGDGNNTLDGGAGMDSMHGGTGDDTYFIDNVKDVIADDGGTDTVTASVSLDLSTFPTTGIENAGLTGTGALNLTGDDKGNVLTGNAGANKIDGRAGDDSMAGGAGNDIYVVDSLGDQVTETDAKNGTDLVQSSVSFTLGKFLENLTLLDTGSTPVNGTGNELNNLITGNNAANILLGGAFTAGNDTTPNGNDTLIGNGGDDSLWGGAGADSLSGGDGNDTLDGGFSLDKSDLQGDTMVGGAGDDLYYVNTSKDVVTEAANGGLHDTIFTTVGYTLGANQEDLVLLRKTSGIGNTLNNTITGSELTDASDATKNGADFINGQAGNDTINGMSGDDTLIGFSGNDSIDGGDGVDEAQFAGKIDDYEISAPDKDGRITVTDKNAAANGNDGTDTLINVERLVFFGDKAGAVTFEVHAQGTSGPDVKTLTSAPDGFDGLEGDDSIDGDGGADTLDGDGGNDTLVGGAGNDVLGGGIGADQYNHAGTSVDGVDAVNTGDNNLDKLVFTTADLFDLGFSRTSDNLTVGAVKSGQTSFDGSVVIVNHYAGGAIGSVLIDTQFNALYGTNASQAKFVFTTDLANGINNTDFTEVLLGTDKSEVLNGNAGFLDILAGGGGNDTLNGGGGDDWLRGGAGTDSLDGGTGINTADYSRAAGGVTVDLSKGTADNDGDGGQDTLANIQRVVGSASADSIAGGNGNETFIGGAGNDTLSGGAGIDQADYSKATSKVTIDLTDGTATGDLSVGTDNLNGIERALGSQFSDSILGDAAIFAELVGSKGNDTIDGAGNGYASYYDSPGAVTASLATGTATDGWGTTDTLKNLVGLTGSDFNDKLTGSTAANTLDGGAGNDTITGGLGNDSIVGGLGNDTAVFSGKSIDYEITDLGGGVMTVKDLNTADGNDGTDTLSGVDALQFSDQTIDGPNTAPVNSVPGAAQVTNEDTKLTFNTANGNLISISDADADGADVQVILDVDHGVLALATTAGLTSVTGNNSATVTLVGTVAEINAALNGLGFTPASNFNGSDTLTITTNDLGHIGTGGALEDKDTVAITITSVNDAPTITSNGGGATASLNVAENTTAVTTVVATDVDTGTTLTYSINGGADAAKFSIDPSTGALSFITPPDFEAPTDSGANNSYVVTVQASDGTLTDTQTITVNVTDVNDSAPVITSNGGGATANVNVGENTTAVATVTATDADSSTLTYSISGGADAAKFTINSSTGALSFIAAPNFEAPTDSGGNNVYDVIVQASDGTLMDTQAIAVTVTNANEAPSITSNGGGATGTDSVVEGTTAVTTVTATDVDAGTTLTYSISGGADAAKFTIDSSTGALSFITAPNFEAPTDTGGNNVYDVIVQVSDGTLTDTQALAVTVTNANEAPVITSNGGGATGAASVAENTTAVTTVIATDVDAGTTITYSISGGADAAKFTINASSGALSFITAPNFEAPTDTGGNNVYDVIVQASDGTLTDTQALAVTVTNANEAPAITSNGGGATGTDSVAEGTTAVTTVTATDVDAATTITYSISGGADAAKFTIDSSTGALSFIAAPNFEAPTDVGGNNVYDVIVQASDGALTDTQALAVTVTNGNDAPVITSNGGGATGTDSVVEGTTAVTTVTATDVDPGTTITYSISGGADAAKFTIDSSTGALSFIVAPNFEAPTDVGGNNVYDVIVQASDGALTDTQALAVTVTNANEAPVITSNGGGATGTDSVVEGTTAVTTVTATDVDAGTAIVYSISGGADAAKFTIDSSTGALSFITAPNFEAPTDTGGNNVYDVIVQASDGALTDTQALGVTVTNANEAPVITSNGGAATGTDSVVEGTTAVTTVTATDVDAGTTIIYSISGGADAAKFTIDSSTGALSFIAAPNFEAPTDTGGNNVYDVIVQASDGSLTDTQALAVTVTNANEAPVITSNGGGATGADSVVEGTTAVTTVTATDVDAGTTITYSINGGVDAAKFTIDSSTGALSFITAPNFEAPTDTGGNNVYDVIVQASDGTLTDTQALAVSVTNANEAPVITSNGGGATGTDSVVEGTTAVTTVTATDVDAGTTITYSINGGADAAKFTIDSSTGALSFATVPNFEAPTDTGGNNVYDVIVQASDGTLTDTQALAVTVTNANEAPVITSNGGGATGTDSVVENTTLVTMVTATDPDAGASLVYSISGGADAAKFTIASSTGALSFITAPNFEAPTDVGGNNVYDVTVQASDGTLTDTQALAVTVTNANESISAITDTNAAGNSVDENAATGTLVGITAFADDPDAGDNVTYSLTKDESGGGFKIDANTGIVTVNDGSKLDFEVDSSHIITVQATSTGGGSTTKDFTITLADLDPETLTGTSEPETLTAGKGNYHISGLGGADTIVGNTGDDLITGGGGDDLLTGGGGTNTFEFSLNPAVTKDTITDFDKASSILSFRDVIDDDGTPGLGIGDLHASVSDDGPGNDVTVAFQNGMSIVFQGAGTGAVANIEDLVADAGTQIQISSS